MKVASREEIVKLDKLAVDLGLSQEILMENAALSVFSLLRKILLKQALLNFAGPGNNGGDALTLARKLSSQFAKVTVFLISEKNKFKGNTLKNLKILANYPVEVIEFKEVNRVLLHELQKCDVIVDGIFGTGLNKEIFGKIKELIIEINNSKNL